MHRKLILVGAALVTLGLGACSSKSATTIVTTTTSSLSSPVPTVTEPAGASTSSTTTNSAPPLAGQPGATNRAALGYVAGYQETAVEAIGLQFLQSDEPADDTPGTQVHCPAVVASVGSTFVCQVDANASSKSSIDEPLKVDGINPLHLEFAVIDPDNFVCSAHATWVVQAMAQAGMPCTSAPTTTQGQGGQGQGGNGQ